MKLSICVIFCAFIVITQAETSNSQIVEELVLTTKIRNRLPVNNQTNFKRRQRAYCWLKITGARRGDNVKINWYANNRLQHTYRLRIRRSGTKTTYSYKTLYSNGAWSVKITGRGGRVLKSLDFTVGNSPRRPNATRVIAPEPPVRNEPRSNSRISAPVRETDRTSTRTTSLRTGNTNIIPPRKIKVAAGYQATIDRPSEVKLPSDYRSDKAYPVVVFLPFTGGSAARFYSFYDRSSFFRQGPGNFMSMLFPGANERDRFSFITMLPSEAASTKDHSWQGFEAATYRYENRIIRDLENLRRKHKIDSKRIVLAGFSMGGDMGWAIIQRHPEKFRGAIISGSRTSWRERSGIKQIKNFGSKLYFVMGEQERADRLKGLNKTLRQLRTGNVPYRYTRTPGSHTGPSFEEFVKGLKYVLN